MDLDTIEHLVTQWLDLLARMVNATGAFERAARLAGLAETLRQESPTSAVPRSLASAGPLTNREREVAAWVARGLTNRQIAEELVISERTADTHIQNILGKLGLNSRAQVAAWIVQRAPLSLHTS